MSEKPLRTVLDEAAHAVDGLRRGTYGHPLDNHGATAALVSTYLRRKYGLPATFSVSPEDVCMINILQKVSRFANAPHRDALVDVCGYARNVELIEDERVARGKPRRQRCKVTHVA